MFKVQFYRTSLIFLLVALQYGGPCYGNDARLYDDVDALRREIKSNPSLVKKLLKNGDTLLHNAALMGHKKVVELLLEKGADPNARGKEYGATPLITAASSGEAEIVALLIKQGANVNAKKKNGDTALHLAAMLVRLETVKVLVKGHADIGIKNRHDMTALDLAKFTVSKHPNPDFVKKGKKIVAVLQNASEAQQKRSPQSEKQQDQLETGTKPNRDRNAPRRASLPYH